MADKRQHQERQGKAAKKARGVAIQKNSARESHEKKIPIFFIQGKKQDHQQRQIGNLTVNLEVAEQADIKPKHQDDGNCIDEVFHGRPAGSGLRATHYYCFTTNTNCKLLKSMGLVRAAFLNKSLPEERIWLTWPIKIFLGICELMPAVTASQPARRSDV